MILSIKTTAQGCHIAVSIKIQGHTILTLTDNDDKSVHLQPKLTYRFEWFVIAGKDNAHARIQAIVTPDTLGFPPLDIAKDYSAGDQDGNVFLFTTN
jgi:hypothetical protein